MPLGDPEEVDAILTSYKMGLKEGERQTVDKIVAWLGRNRDDLDALWRMTLKQESGDR